MKSIINFFSKIGLDITSKLISLITFPLIARSLGVENFGLYIYMGVIISYFTIPMDFGFSLYATREISTTKDSSIISTLVSFSFFVSIFSFILSLIFGYFNFVNIYAVYIILSFQLFIISFNIKSYYIATNKIFVSSIYEIISQLVFLIGIFTIFVRTKSLFSLIVLSVIQSFISTLLIFLHFIKSNKFKLSLNIGSFILLLKNSFKLGIIVKLEFIVPSITLFFTGLFLSQLELGLYSSIYKIFTLFLMIPAAINLTLSSHLGNLVSSGKSETENKISLILYIFICVGLFASLSSLLIGNYLIQILYGQEYFDSIIYFKIFSSVVFFLWPIIICLNSIIIWYKRELDYLYNCILMSISSISLSFFLINYYGLIGAVLVLPIVSIIGSGISIIYFVKFVDDKKIDKARIFNPIIGYKFLISIIKKV